MRKLLYFFSMLWTLLSFQVHAQNSSYALVTASNDPNVNELLLYSAEGKLLQKIPTQGKGGVAPNIVGGGIAKNETLLAVINYNSQTVSLFKRQAGGLKHLQVIPSLSKPVSLVFGNNHLYILGTTTIESHKINGDYVEESPDGNSRLFVGDGSAAQVGLLTNQLIASERSRTIELIDLRDGIVTDKIQPVQLPPPPGNDTPVGLVTRGNTAYVTIAHSDKVGLVRDGKLIALVSPETQHAPCWLALTGPWLYSANTPSQSISRYRVTENTIVLDELIAAKVKEGLPSDMDAQDKILAVLNTGNGMAQLSQYQIDDSGKLNLVNTTPTATTANGVAIIKL